MPLVASPRRRRRLAWLAGVAGVCLALGVVAVVVPSTTGGRKDAFSNQPVQRVTTERQVPVTPATRAAVDRLFDAFVSEAVARRDPAAAYDLVTDAFRAGTSRASWRRGRVPVFPYEPRGRRFHGWTVELSYANRLSVQLYLEPRNPKDGPVAYSVDLRRMHGSWLIDAFYPRSTYAPASPAGEPRSGTTRTAPQPTAEPKGHGGLLWAVMLGFVVLVLAVPICFFAAQWISGRRVRRRALAR
jgi:hypothetical protein